MAGQTEEEKLDPDQEDADVIPPFNAYAKSGTIQVRAGFAWNNGEIIPWVAGVARLAGSSGGLGSG